LVRECNSKDTILVQINPVERPGLPRSARDILNRLNEVSFNAVLLKELRMIALLRQVAQPDNSESAKWAGMRIHRISSDVMVELGYSSKLNADWEFLCMLRDEGRRAGDAFLRAAHDDLGGRPTFALDELLDGVCPHGSLRDPARIGAAHMARAARLERAPSRPGRRSACRRLRAGAAARQLDADLHGQRGGLP